ncbi:TPA: endolysin, partial [Enterococcus faecium]|nr:endolysin [Enterococcus faecium]
MNGIDISSHQTGIDLSKVPCDFVNIKATGGTGYVNPDCDRAFQ